MRALSAILALLCCLSGCAPTAQERINEMSADGLRLYRRGAFADARNSFQAALALRPYDADLIYNLARCQEKLGKTAEAEELYSRVLEHAPDHLETRHALITRQYDAGQKDLAQKMVHDWLRASPGNAGPYIEEAWLRTRAGDLDTARARLQQALDRDPRHPRALFELAQIFDQPLVTQKLEQLRARGVSRPRPD
jgi:Tfp pilus assembly protein PilF